MVRVAIIFWNYYIYFWKNYFLRENALKELTTLAYFYSSQTFVPHSSHSTQRKKKSSNSFHIHTEKSTATNVNIFIPFIREIHGNFFQFEYVIFFFAYIFSSAQTFKTIILTLLNRPEFSSNMKRMEWHEAIRIGYTGILSNLVIWNSFPWIFLYIRNFFGRYYSMASYASDIVMV